MPPSPEPLLIVGASARAAAQAALRAGRAPLACDLFADADLRRVAAAVRVEDYPRGLAAAAATFPPAEWLYTGGLENHPELVDEIARLHRLLGVSGEALRAVRDPWRVAAVLAERGLPCPPCRRVDARVPADGRWLLKRRASAGGAGIRPWVGTPPGVVAAAADRREYYLQRRVAGRACSAVYLAAGGRAILLGITEQLIGASWCGGRGFQYCGSVGPLRPRTETRERFCRLGDCLAEEFSLVGLFGVDAIVNRRGAWPVEVNPRYTASVEVLERALAFPAIHWHVAACREGQLPDELSWQCDGSLHVAESLRDAMASLGETRPRDPPKLPPPKPSWCGKAILFARQDLTIDQPWSDALAGGIVDPRAHWPTIADVPAAGAHIATHRPVVTIFAEGSSRPSVLRQLRSAAAGWHAEFERGMGGPISQTAKTPRNAGTDRG